MKVVIVFFILGVSVINSADIGNWKPAYPGARQTVDCKGILGGLDDTTEFIIGRALGGPNTFPIGIPVVNGIIGQPTYIYGTQITAPTNFDILCNLVDSDPAWMPRRFSDGDKLNEPVSVAIGQIESSAGYICRAVYDFEIYIGYIHSVETVTGCTFLIGNTANTSTNAQAEILISTPRSKKLFN